MKEDNLLEEDFELEIDDEVEPDQETYYQSLILHNVDGMVYMENTDEYYAYYIAATGFKKTDLHVLMGIEKDLLNILVYLEKITNFALVNKCEFKFNLNKIKYENENDVSVTLDKGVLEIKVFKI